MTDPKTPGITPEQGATASPRSADGAPRPVEFDAASRAFAMDEAPVEPGPLARGAAVIASFLRHAPTGPGVYRMFSGEGEVLYVGKARSIKKRLASYTKPGDQSTRIARMIAQTASVVFITTQSEAEALLLEANLIKQLKPRYNVLLRDDKSFPYIHISGEHEAPQLSKHRGARVGKGEYFGPFASGSAVFHTLNALQRAFLLRTCSDSYYENRTRPCLQFQIKRCAAPCTREINLEDYAKLVEEARDFLKGRSRSIRQRLANEMSQASDSLQFEQAARLRDRIAALSAIQGEQSINPRSIPEADVFAICEEAGQFCVEVFFFRTYQNWGNRAFFPRADRSLDVAEVLDSFLAQFYLERPAPRLVLLSHPVRSADALRDILSARVGHRIAIGVPRRGEKKELVENAQRNAREALARKLAETSSQQNLLAAVAAAFGLAAPPRRVEVFDNSHISGTNAIGAMIVAGPEGLVKGQYRTFNIKSQALTPGDDYAMMREVLTRRFARLVKAPLVSPQGEDAFPDKPDLVLIDGGRGQFDVARQVMRELGVVDVHMASIAKGPDRNAGRETFFVAGREPFKLPPRDPALFFVQRLRDEAHRFAIGAHRAKRSKSFVKSPLDEIPGIGPSRKRALLHAFGAAKDVSRAGLADLLKTPGVNAATAKAVYAFFHEGEVA